MYVQGPARGPDLRRIVLQRGERGVREHDVCRIVCRGGAEGAPALLRPQCAMTSVKLYPRMIMSTPGTRGYRLSYKRVLRVVHHKPPSSGII